MYCGSAKSTLIWHLSGPHPSIAPKKWWLLALFSTHDTWPNEHSLLELIPKMAGSVAYTFSAGDHSWHAHENVARFSEPQRPYSPSIKKLNMVFAAYLCIECSCPCMWLSVLSNQFNEMSPCYWSMLKFNVYHWRPILTCQTRCHITQLDFWWCVGIIWAMLFPAMTKTFCIWYSETNRMGLHSFIVMCRVRVQRWNCRWIKSSGQILINSLKRGFDKQSPAKVCFFQQFGWW